MADEKLKTAKLKSGRVVLRYKFLHGSEVESSEKARAIVEKLNSSESAESVDRYILSAPLGLNTLNYLVLLKQVELVDALGIHSEVSESLRRMVLSPEARAKGTRHSSQKQADHAAKDHAVMLNMNRDLLLNSDTAKWQLPKRAEFIAKKCEEQGIKKPNGGRYAVSTVQRVITGAKPA